MNIIQYIMMFILYCTHSWISAMVADGLILIQPPKQLQGMVGLQPNLAVRFDKYSLLMHRIKIKIPAIFFMEWITRFCGWIYHFSISHIWRYYNDKKAYRIFAVHPFKMSANSLSCGLPCSLASTPWAMSLYFKLRAISVFGAGFENNLSVGQVAQKIHLSWCCPKLSQTKKNVATHR